MLYIQLLYILYRKNKQGRTIMLGTSEIFGNVSHFSGNTLVFFLSEFGFFSSRGYDLGVGCSQ